MKRSLLATVFLLATLNSERADIIAQWNFNSPTPDSDTGTGTTVASWPGAIAGTCALIGGTSATFATGSTNDPALQGDDSGWNTASYPSQATSNKTAGVQFNVNTMAYSNIVIRWDQKVSSSASKYYRLQYSSDGINFSDYATPVTMLVVSSTGSYYEAQTNSLATIPSINNNPNFAFRIVSEFESTATGSGTNGYITTQLTNNYSTAGTVRFDLVTVSGTVIPGANTPPSISTISNQTIRINQSTAALQFTINDAQDPGSSLTLNKASSDPSVIPEANIVFGGSGNDRTATITAINQTGSSTITLYVIDTGGRSNSTSFTVTVLPLNTAPSISSLPPANTLINTPTAPIDFIINDLETTPSSLTLSASSANPGLVPNGNIVFGGSDSNRTVTITPAAGQTGVAPITITVSDSTNAASSAFALMVVPSPSVIFYDPFTYPNGSLLTNSAFLWDNRSGTLGQCEVTNGQLLIVGATGEDVIGSLINGPYDRSNNIVLYSAFKATFLTLPKSAPGYFAHFANGSTLHGRVYAGTTNAGPGTFRLFVANGTDTNTAFASDLNTNTAYTVVSRYNIDTATTTLWLNPLSEASSSVTATDIVSAINISSYGFRQDASLGATVLIDDLKIGLSFAAVTTTNASPTPIPLRIQSAAGKVILSWNDPSFSLQAAPTVTGTYTNILGASSPYTNIITAQPKFFRLKAN